MSSDCREHIRQDGSGQSCFSTENADGKPENVTLIKSNPVRRVWRDGNLFFKSEKRKPLYSKAKREYNSLLLLQKLNIPAVRPVKFYSSGEFDVLVTENFAADAIDCNSAWEKSAGKDPVFVSGYFDFVRKILEANIWHPDFHNGNILYSPEKNAFALVDVYGVKKQSLFHRLPVFRRRMTRIILEAREFIPYAGLKSIYTGITRSGGEAFDAALKRESAAVLREWPRRRKQILNCYSKFAEKSPNGTFFSLNSARKRYAAAGKKRNTTPEEAEKLWLEHFFLQLNRLPHVKILAKGSDFVIEEEDFVLLPGFEPYFALAGLAVPPARCS